MYMSFMCNLDTISPYTLLDMVLISSVLTLCTSLGMVSCILPLVLFQCSHENFCELQISYRVMVITTIKQLATDSPAPSKEHRDSKIMI